jgi:hypothetical protein
MPEIRKILIAYSSIVCLPTVCGSELPDITRAQITSPKVIGLSYGQIGMQLCVHSETTHQSIGDAKCIDASPPDPGLT